MSVSAFIEELRKNVKAREEFISEIMPDIMLRLALDKDLRISLLRSIAGEVATKDDLKELERNLKEYVDRRIDDVNKRIDDLNRRIDDVNRNVRVTLIAILMTLLATIIVPLILRVLGIIT